MVMLVILQKHDFRNKVPTTFLSVWPPFNKAKIWNLSDIFNRQNAHTCIHTKWGVYNYHLQLPIDITNRCLF